MRVLICGATGNIGRLAVDKALKAGHEVTAFARSPEKLNLDQDKLHKAKGNIMDLASVEIAMAGQDVALTVFGAPLNWSTLTKIPNLCTTGTRNIISAMKQHQVKRFICMTGIGAGDSRRHGRFVFDNLILPLLLARIYEDKNSQEKEVMQSDLDWMIVRPAELTDETELGNYRVLTALEGIRAKTIPRADVANFLVEQINSDRYLHQTPLITR
jgi:putative NADH-flavin reductase